MGGYFSSESPTFVEDNKDKINENVEIIEYDEVITTNELCNQAKKKKKKKNKRKVKNDI